MTKKFLQLFSIFALVVIFCWSLLPVSADQGKQQPDPDPTPMPTPVLQELQPASIQPNTQSSMTPQNDTRSEVVELRTATSKHYRLGQNLYQAEISAAPTHYQDADGHWQEIDLEPVVRSEGGFETVANNVKIAFPERLDQAGLTVTATIYPSPSPPPQRQLESFDFEGPKPDLATLLSNDTVTTQSSHNSSPINLPLQWRPQYLVYANETGPLSDKLQITESSATAIANGVEYAQAFDNVTTSFHASLFGFSQRLHFAALPIGSEFAVDNNATKLEYAVEVTLPPDVQLYANGLEQEGDFTTERLELRDQAGQRLLVIPAPQLRDQVVSRIAPQTQYRVEPTAGGIILVAELPLAWLADPIRQYPVTAEFQAIFALGLTDALFPVQQDTWIWECVPNGNDGSGARMWVGHFSDVGCSLGAERALVQWATVSLPQDALIVDEPFGLTRSFLWRLPDGDTGSGIQTIGTHRLVAPWEFGSTTWLNRTASETWSQPGADEDYLIATENTVAVPAAGTEGYLDMGTVDSLVGAWHTNQYIFSEGYCTSLDFCWGDPNRGVIYKSINESGPNQDRAFAQIGFSGVVSAPTLITTYFTDTHFVVDPDDNFFLPRAPSPDYFQIDPVSSWRAFGIRAVDGGSDYDLFLSASPRSFEISDFLTASLEIGNAADFIVLRPDVSIPLYPWSAQWEGTGRYFQRYATQADTLTLGNTLSGQALTFTVLSIYEVDLTAGTNYEISLDITSGNQDLGLALFAPAAAGGRAHVIRAGAVKLSDSASFGGNEKLVFAPDTSGSYGLVVWNDGGTQNTNYQLSLQESITTIYLPVVFKNFEPDAPAPANLGFETGSFPPWMRTDIGGPMVASVVPNNSPVPSGCFSGNFTARLGTPGQLAINTIPVGEVNFVQRFNVPDNVSQLTFKYWVSSYDVIQGSTTGRFYDRFEVSVDDKPVHTDGNPAGSSNGETLWESGCKTVSVPVIPGDNITLKFSLFNLVFPRFNTWAYVDDITFQ